MLFIQNCNSKEFKFKRTLDSLSGRMLDGHRVTDVAAREGTRRPARDGRENPRAATSDRARSAKDLSRRPRRRTSATNETFSLRLDLSCPRRERRASAHEKRIGGARPSIRTSRTRFHANRSLLPTPIPRSRSSRFPLRSLAQSWRSPVTRPPRDRAQRSTFRLRRALFAGRSDVRSRPMIEIYSCGERESC